MDVTAGTRGLHREPLAVIWVGNDQTSKLAYTAPPVPCVFGRASSRQLPSTRLQVNGKGLDWQSVDLWALAPQTQTVQAHAAFRL